MDQVAVADVTDAEILLGLRDDAARWQQARGVQQWQPGEVSLDQLRQQIARHEWQILRSAGGTAALRLLWADAAMRGPQPPVAGYVHGLVRSRESQPGAGTRLLAWAEGQVGRAGRRLLRLDCLDSNAPLRQHYERLGYCCIGSRALPTGSAVALYEKEVDSARPAQSPEAMYSDGVVTIRRQHPADLDASLTGIDDAQIDWLWEPGDRELWEALDAAGQREHQRRHLQAVHDAFGPGPKWCFSVDGPNDRYVAYVDCDLANPHVPHGQANISYVCHPQHRRQGYTSRAVQLACSFLREHTDATEAHVVVDVRNTASLAVAQSINADKTGSFVDEHGRTMVRHVLKL